MLEKSKNLNTQNGALPVLTAANFKAEVLASELPVLVSFGRHGAAHVRCWIAFFGNWPAIGAKR